MDLMQKDDIDTRSVSRQLPPLIKGYLRVGAFVGDGAVVDYQFGTTDVLVIMPVSSINSRYVDFFDQKRTGRSLPSAPSPVVVLNLS